MDEKDDEPVVPVERADDVAGLIRLAGRRPGVPPDRAARVKVAVREQWIDQVRQGRRRRRMWAAAAVAAAASLALAIPFLGGRPGSDAVPPRTAATVESLQGSGWIAADRGGREAARRPLKRGDVVTSRSRVGSDEGGRVALRLSTGHSLRLDRGTVLRIEEASDVMLEAGSVYVDSGDGAARAGSRVMRTRLGVVREIGTLYEVRLTDGGLRVRVREGRVALDVGSQVREVAAAGELALGEDGTVASRRIAIHGPEWDWIAPVTTVPELDGMNPRALLEWVARERGWRLRFDTEELARTAGRITLDGSLERLSLDQALDAVLPTCGLSYRLEEDALVISQAGDGAGGGAPGGVQGGHR